MTQPVFLVGARGCGKTTVGQTLAYQLQTDFVDTDVWLTEIMQQTVAEIVDAGGWPDFRARESQALVAVTAPGRVIATGGGMVLAAENRQFMREQGTVIWLRAPAPVLAGRLSAFSQQGQRPTLTGQPITDEIMEVLAARELLYHDAAHYAVNATGTPTQVAYEIVQILRLAKAG